MLKVDKPQRLKDTALLGSVMLFIWMKYSEQKKFFSGLELVPGIPGNEFRVVSVSMLLKSREILPA